MPQYDPAIIEKFADRLYRSANSIILVYTLLGALIGGGVGYAVGSYLESVFPVLSPVGGLVFVGTLGYLQGVERAFKLKLEAQRALCLLAIEKNTRRESR